MKRTPIKKLGKIGKINMEANRRLKDLFVDVNFCEIKLDGCMETWPLAFAHRHSRSWYRTQPDKLSESGQVLVACQVCHTKIDNDEVLKEKVFKNLRGHE